MRPQGATGRGMLGQFLSVGIGGAFGAMARYGVGLGIVRLFGHGFPLAILTVNVVGSFLMGVLVTTIRTSKLQRNLQGLEMKTLRYSDDQSVQRLFRHSNIEFFPVKAGVFDFLVGSRFGLRQNSEVFGDFSR